MLIPWLLIIIILYIFQFNFILNPDIDIYIGSLGIYGTLLISFGMILSAFYASSCAHKNTVYRCVGWGCGESSLRFPQNSSDEIKNIYENSLKDIPDGWSTYHPWSSYNKKLHELNISLFK
jgi:hypothetical protein